MFSGAIDEEGAADWGMRLARRLWPRTFRGQMAIGFALLALVMSITLSLVLGGLFAEKSERDETLALQTIARNAAQDLSDGLTTRSREIEALANSKTLWLGGLASANVEQSILRIQKLTAFSAWIGVVAPDGVVQAATGGLLEHTNVSDRPWFQKGVAATHVGDVHPAKLLAALLPRGSDGGPQRFVDFASPIMQDGRVIGVLGMHGSWDWTRSVVIALLPEDAVARALRISILDREGRVIFSSAHDSAGAPPPPRQDVISQTARVKPSTPGDLGWSVVVDEPSAVALAAARAGVKRALGLGLLAALIASGLGWLMAERLTRQLRRMADDAYRVQRGEAGAVIRRSGGSAEVTRLSEALAGMTRRLVESNAELESRVHERTAALEQANAELDRQARVDPLTGLLNRRGMDELFRHSIATARRRGSPLSVLMVDIDHFKRVNDSFGHDAGDVALQALAAVLLARLRETDVVARLGGEEFVALLPDTDAAQARRLAATLVEIVADHAIAIVGGITVSCGVAQWRESDTAKSVLARADEALYRAKEEGRNRAGFADTSLELSGNDAFPASGLG